MQIWSMSEPIRRHDAMRTREVRTRDVLTPLMMMSAGAVLAFVVVLLADAGTLAYPIGLIAGIATLPWIVASIPVSARYRASEQGFSGLLLTIAVFVALSGLYAGYLWPFIVGLALLGIGLALFAVGRRAML